MPLQIIPDYLRDLNLISIVLRFLLAALCGGIIGAERGRSQHAAGLRTHLLVCIGAASCMMVNQYIAVYISPGSDVARIGAQVVSGIGFLGAGTILVTRQNRISGLTTAAGLWASACMGLTAGIGFYECAIVLCVMMFVVLSVLTRLDYRFLKSSTGMRVYVEFNSDCRLGMILDLLKRDQWRAASIEPMIGNSTQVCGLYIVLDKRPPIKDYDGILEQLRILPGMLYADRV